MVGIKKDVTIEGIVNTVVDNVWAQVGNKKLKWKVFWEDVWEQIIDEAAFYDIIIKNDVTPMYPEYLDSIKDKKSEIKKLLTQIIEERIKQ